MGSITVRIDDGMEADLARIAKAKGRTKSELVREMHRRYTSSELFELARHELRPFAEAKGYLTDEDFFRDFS